MRKVLFIGGTGTISKAIVDKLVSEKKWEVYLLNRGNRKTDWGDAVNQITVDINDEKLVNEKLGDLKFDVVCEFIGFTVDQVERDYRLFKDRTKQYIYISSASAYHKLPADYVITEGTTLSNPYWEYSRNKIACEEYLMKKYREEGFPITIVRPSHTYDERNLPIGVEGSNGSYQVIKRMKEDKPVIIQGDGTSLWHVTFNRDFAIGFVGLLGNVHAIGEAFHITGDEVLTWNQIYQTIANALNVELHPYYVSSSYLASVGKKYDYTGSLIGDKSNSVRFDNSKIKSISPDMKTNIPFNEGVRICLDYIESHPECQKDDQEFDEWCDKIIEILEDSKKGING